MPSNVPTVSSSNKDAQNSQTYHIQSDEKKKNDEITFTRGFQDSSQSQLTPSKPSYSPSPDKSGAESLISTPSPHREDSPKISSNFNEFSEFVLATSSDHLENLLTLFAEFMEKKITPLNNKISTQESFIQELKEENAKTIHGKQIIENELGETKKTVKKLEQENYNLKLRIHQEFVMRQKLSASNAGNTNESSNTHQSNVNNTTQINTHSNQLGSQHNIQHNNQHNNQQSYQHSSSHSNVQSSQQSGHSNVSHSSGNSSNVPSSSSSNLTNTSINPSTPVHNSNTISNTVLRQNQPPPSYKLSPSAHPSMHPTPISHPSSGGLIVNPPYILSSGMNPNVNSHISSTANVNMHHNPGAPMNSPPSTNMMGNVIVMRPIPGSEYYSSKDHSYILSSAQVLNFDQIPNYPKSSHSRSNSIESSSALAMRPPSPSPPRGRQSSTHTNQNSNNIPQVSTTQYHQSDHGRPNQYSNPSTHIRTSSYHSTSSHSEANSVYSNQSQRNPQSTAQQVHPTTQESEIPSSVSNVPNISSGRPSTVTSTSLIQSTTITSQPNINNNYTSQSSNSNNTNIPINITNQGANRSTSQYSNPSISSEEITQAKDKTSQRSTTQYTSTHETPQKSPRRSPSRSPSGQDDSEQYIQIGTSPENHSPHHRQRPQTATSYVNSPFAQADMERYSKIEVGSIEYQKLNEYEQKIVQKHSENKPEEVLEVLFSRKFQHPDERFLPTPSAQVINSPSRERDESIVPVKAKTRPSTPNRLRTSSSVGSNITKQSNRRTNQNRTSPLRSSSSRRASFGGQNPPIRIKESGSTFTETPSQSRRHSISTGKQREFSPTSTSSSASFGSVPFTEPLSPHSVKSSISKSFPLSPYFFVPSNTHLDLDLGNSNRCLRHKRGNMWRSSMGNISFQNEGIHQFSIFIEETSGGHPIRIGIADSEFILSSACGESPLSYAIDTSTGNVFHSRNEKVYYTGRIPKNSTITVIIDLDNYQLRYQLNNESLGVAWNLKKNVEYFPCVSLLQKDSCVRFV